MIKPRFPNVVDVTYQDLYNDMYTWCRLNLTCPISLQLDGGLEGPNWMIYNTTANVEPFYLITRGLFESEDDMVLFKMRWL